jgi:hypothetical protein
MHRTPVAYLTPTIFLLHKGPHQSPLFVFNNFQNMHFFFQICIYRVYIINMLMLIIFTENDCKNYIYKSCLGFYRFLNVIFVGEGFGLCPPSLFVVICFLFIYLGCCSRIHLLLPICFKKKKQNKKKKDS